MSKENKVTKNKGGRPTDFTPELGAEICSKLIDIGSLRKVCEADDMPSARTVFRWLLKSDCDDAPKEYVEFCQQYTHAREISKDYQFDGHWEELQKTAQVPMCTEEGVPLVDPNTGEVMMTVTTQSIALAKLQHDSFKWQASKENPKKYGDRQEIHATGVPLVIVRNLTGE